MAEINEVKLNGETILSTRSNTVTEDTLVQGETAQNKAGESIVGRLDPVDKDKAYLISDEIGDIDNADYMPFYDTSEQKKKKTLFGSIVEKLKSVFAQKTDLKAHTYEVGTEIPANADLNNYTTVGVYQCLLDATAQTISNTPYSDTQRTAFKLIVLALRKSQNVMQIFIPYISNHYGMAGKIAYRTYENSWGQWNHIASTEAVHYLAQPDLARQITANQDLNDYTESGTYQCNNGLIACTLSNCPVTYSFKLVVDRAYENNTHSEITQRITCQNATQLDWYRTKIYNASTWGAWKQLASTDDIAPSTVGNGYAVGTLSGTNITATISGFKLKAGVIVAIRLVYGLPANCTLNISNTGVKDIYYWGDYATGKMDVLNSSSVYTFMYDGTRYRLLTWSLAPTIFKQNYVADTSGNIGINVGYNNNAFQIKNQIGINKLVWNYYKNSAWHGDVKIADYDDLVHQSLGISIPDNANLNDYTTNGIYNIQSNTRASTITNIPVTRAGKLIVMRVAGNTYINQFYITYNNSLSDNDGIFRRSYTGSAWLAWRRLTSDNDAGASIAKTGKSILPIWRANTNVLTSNGVTATFNPTTGEITLNGTATAKTYFPIFTGKGLTNVQKLPKGTYVLSGCPSGGSSTTYELDFYCSEGSWFEHGSGVTFTLSSDALLNDDMFIFVASGQTVSNLVFKPMLRPAFTTADYEPCEDIHKGNCYVGTCTTAGATKDKVAYVDGYFVLRKGVRVAIKYSNTNTHSSSTANPITLNVNNTGAKNIWYGSNHTGASSGQPTGVATFVFGYAGRYTYYIYDGTYWIWDGTGVDNNSTNFLRNDASSTMTTTIPFLYLKGTSIDTKQDNNGVTNIQFPAFAIQDKNGEVTTRLESIIETNGNVSTYMYARNYNKNTSQYFLGGLKVIADKIGNLWYDITNPERFNVAIGHGYGVCGTAEATTAKTVAISYYKLVMHGYVTVKFTYNVPANATLNINSKGAKNIWYRGANITANVIKAGDLATFIYDGTRYQLVSNDRWGL